MKKNNKNDFVTTIVKIICTGNKFSLEIGRLLKPYKISLQQYYALKLLMENYPNSLPVGVLSSNMLDNSSNVSRILEKLQKKNLIYKKKCEKDKRSYKISLTPSGISMYNNLDKSVKKIKNFFPNLNNKENKKLKLIIDKINI